MLATFIKGAGLAGLDSSIEGEEGAAAGGSIPIKKFALGIFTSAGLFSEIFFGAEALALLT
jgi:hypothetical protein